MNENRGAWIQTASGAPWYPYTPTSSDVHLADMRALSRICRFAGHLRDEVDHYSVAQHCAIVSDELLRAGHGAEVAFFGLVHDAHEAYPPHDVSAPLKHGTRFARAATDMEGDAMIAVGDFFSVPEPGKDIEELVLEFDLRALATEKRDLLNRSVRAWRRLPEPFDGPIVPVGAREAWQSWIGRVVVDGNVGAAKLTLTWSESCAANATGLSLTGVATSPTVSGVSSGSGTATHVYDLSANVAGTDSPVVHVALTRLVQSSSGGRKAAVGKYAVSVTNLSNPLLTSPGTMNFWLGADSVTLTSTNVDTYVDKGPAGNTVSFTGTTKAVQSTTGGGNKKAVHVANTYYRRNALTSNVPANHSGTFYLVAKINNWNPSGGYAAVMNLSPDAVEGSTHYDRGIYVTPSGNAYWKAGYGVDGNITYTLNPVPNANINVWAFTYEHDGVMKIYKNGTLEFTSATMTPDPGALAALSFGTLWFSSHTSTEMDFYQCVFYSSSDTSAVHDASTVATNSTFLATFAT